MAIQIHHVDPNHAPIFVPLPIASQIRSHTNDEFPVLRVSPQTSSWQQLKIDNNNCHKIEMEATNGYHVNITSVISRVGSWRNTEESNGNGSPKSKWIEER